MNAFNSASIALCGTRPLRVACARAASRTFERVARDGHGTHHRKVLHGVIDTPLVLDADPGLLRGTSVKLYDRHAFSSDHCSLRPGGSRGVSTMFVYCMSIYSVHRQSLLQAPGVVPPSPSDADAGIGTISPNVSFSTLR